MSHVGAAARSPFFRGRHRYATSADPARHDVRANRPGARAASLADRFFDSITCMHLIEHLTTVTNLWREIARVLKPAGRVYIETPGPESVRTRSAPNELRGKVTLNFFDDPTHVLPVTREVMASAAREHGLIPAKSGKSRNWIFAASYPFFALLPARRQRYVAKLHWLGWSVYLIARKPAA